MTYMFALYIVFIILFIMLKNSRSAIFLFSLLFLVQVYSYFRYFNGGWEASGHNYPFNEELIFSNIILSATAAFFGLAASVVHFRLAPFGNERAAKIKIFCISIVAFFLFAGLLVVAVPLSFEMPIDINKCDGSATQPEYCP